MHAPAVFDPERLEQLSRALMRAAEAGEHEEARAVLDQRQELLGMLETLPDDMDRERVRTALETMQSLDARTESLLRARSDALREDLRALGAGRRGLAGYAGRRSGAGSRIDERG